MKHHVILPCEAQSQKTELCREIVMQKKNPGHQSKLSKYPDDKFKGTYCIRFLYSMQDQLLDQALEFHRKGQLKEALTIYQDLLKDKKPKLHVFLNASAILRSAEKHSEAISCLQRGTHLYPQEPGTWNNLGNCHLDLGQLTKAIIAYRQSLKLEQSFTDARVSLAACLPARARPSQPGLRNTTDALSQKRQRRRAS